MDCGGSKLSGIIIKDILISRRCTLFSVHLKTFANFPRQIVTTCKVFIEKGEKVNEPEQYKAQIFVSPATPSWI